MKYMFLNSMLCMVYLFSSMCKIEPVCFYLLLEPELFPFDTILNAAECMVGQILETESSDFFDHQCQTSQISYHSKGIAFL